MKQLPLDAFKDYKFISGLTYSPCGQYLSYHIHQSQDSLKDYDSNLWLTDLKHQTHRPFTSSNKVKQHHWLPQTHNILFQTVKTEEDLSRIKSGQPLSIYYTISPLGGESIKYMEIPLHVTKLHALTDQKFLLTASYTEFFDKFHLLSKEAQAEKFAEFEAEKDYEVIEEIPFWQNGGSFKRKARNRLYIYDLTSGEVLPLTDETFQVESFNVEGSKVLYTGKHVQDKMSLCSQVYLLDLENHTSTCIFDQDYMIRYAYFLDPDHVVVLGSDMATYGLNQNPTFIKVNCHTKAYSPFAEAYTMSTGSSVGSDCRLGSKTQIKAVKGDLYLVTTDLENAPLYRISKTGDIRKLTDFQGSVDDLAIHQDQVAYVAMVDQDLNEIYSQDGQNRHKLTAFNSWVKEAYTIIEPQVVKGQAKDGPLIDGWVLKPRDFDPQKKYPCILDIHGGPKTAFGTVFYHEMQAWANAGYMVCYCNPRGSDGRGSAFADIRGKYGSIDYQDIMAFTDSVIQEFPSVDVDNFFVTGGSYGGFMTNWIVGHTKRFKAAASQRSISNWMTEYGVTDIGYFFVPDQMKADPFDDYEKMWFHSPLKYVKNVTTPLLFIHSDADYRCWIPEALQMFTALKDLGAETKLCIFKGENHELSRSGKPNHRLRRLKEITTWFDQHQE